MTVLHLGVNDVPYTSAGAVTPRRVVHRRNRAGMTETFTAPAQGAEMTGDVAVWLEHRYHIMEIFFELHQDDIAEALTESMSGALDNLLMGAPSTGNPLDAGLLVVENLFRKFLSEREIEFLGFPGIPTMAAKLGVNHRLKQKRGAPRPSFIDTGLYQANFRAWID